MARIGRSSSGGNVNIQDTNGNSLTSSSGGLDVNVISSTPSFPQETLSTYSEVDSVAAGSVVTVLTYTVPNGLTLYLNKILVSSDQIAQMDLEFNGDINARKRLSYTVFNETFDYSLNGNIGGYKLDAGTVITVIGTNLSGSGPASFNATLQGVQE